MQTFGSWPSILVKYEILSRIQASLMINDTNRQSVTEGDIPTERGCELLQLMRQMSPSISNLA